MDLKQKLKESGIKQVQLAREFGLTKPAVNAWLRNGVPVKYCERLEILSAGRITRREMRPHDYAQIWPGLAGSVKLD